MDYTKFRSFCTAKNTSDKKKEASNRMGKTFESYLSNQRLISRIYQQTKNSTIQNQPIQLRNGQGTQYAVLQRKNADGQQI